MSLKRSECDCKELKCFCGLPLFMMDHLQLPCCDKGKYHVLCISKRTNCVECNEEFSKHIKMFINNAHAMVMQKFKKEQKNELKRKKTRKECQKLIKDTIFVKYFT